jgi:hypothetical protein
LTVLFVVERNVGRRRQTRGARKSLFLLSEAKVISKQHKTKQPQPTQDNHRAHSTARAATITRQDKKRKDQKDKTRQHMTRLQKTT